MGDEKGLKDIKVPKGGRGIKWSTLKQKRRKVKLANGEETEVPVTWRAFNNSATYLGYEVELDKDPTIQVWVLITASAPTDGNDYTGWCHGLTFNDTIYSPGGEAIPAILAAAWKEIRCSDAKKETLSSTTMPVEMLRTLQHRTVTGHIRPRVATRHQRTMRRKLRWTRPIKCL